jgi:hypothetical protein
VTREPDADPADALDVADVERRGAAGVIVAREPVEAEDVLLAALPLSSPSRPRPTRLTIAATAAVLRTAENAILQLRELTRAPHSRVRVQDMAHKADE